MSKISRHQPPTFIDLFAGAGGLSEGFISAGYNPVAHVEMDADACNTLRTRTAYHFLKNTGKLRLYNDYLIGKVSRTELYSKIPTPLLESVIEREIAKHTLKAIFSQIDKIMIEKGVETIDVIAGGPPCQAYSVIGRSRDPKRMKGDRRYYLFRLYAKFLHRYKPKIFVFENVLGLQSAGNRRYLNEMLKTFQLNGYHCDLQILSADHYGVLQKRKRIIITGKLNTVDFNFPRPHTTVYTGKLGADVFGDLPAPAETWPCAPALYTGKPSRWQKLAGIRDKTRFVSQHATRPVNQQDREIYGLAIQKLLTDGKQISYPELPDRLKTHRNVSGFTDRFKVLNPDGLSHTVVAHLAKDGHHYIVPDMKNPRSVSIREAARIQSFPDNYFFEGSRTAAFRQIGNAVAPGMATAIAHELTTGTT